VSNGKELLGERYEREQLTYEEIEGLGLTVVTEKGETVSAGSFGARSSALQTATNRAATW
jgi:hypothetical protein